MLHDFIIEKYIKEALEEDIGFGDITTDFIASNEDFIKGTLGTRESGIICGCEIFKKVFEILSKDVEVKFSVKDGDFVKSGDIIESISGRARYILTGERTALNYIQRMSGIATETKKYQDAIGKSKAYVTDTRKTTPNFRIFEKYAVKTGGAKLHRFNLSDCAMIKDNHIKLAGSITEAGSRLRKNISHAHKIEVECDTLKQVKEALSLGVEIIMLDNMGLDEMKQACEMIKNRAIVEASGNITLETIGDVASCGVDVISTSAIVAKAPTLDLGLDI